MTPKQRRSAAARYDLALERGDLETAAAVLDLAADDPELLARILELDASWDRRYAATLPN